MTSGWVFVFKNNQSYVYQINSGILTTLLQFEIFCKIVNMSWIAGWQDLVLLCSNTVGFPDHFNKLHKLPFEWLESSGMRRTFCKFQWTKSMAMVNYKEKTNIFVASYHKKIQKFQNHNIWSPRNIRLTLNQYSISLFKHSEFKD